MSRVAAMIVARDAEETIGAAIASALAEPIDELVLLDDASSDGTLEVARSFADSRMKVLQVDAHSTLGWARSCGLRAVSSEYCVLLDADDWFLPGRVERLTRRMDGDELDFVADELELVDGETGRFIRRMPIPAFLDKAPGLWRLFERNHLPGIGQIAFRTDFMKRLDYDRNAHGVEDSDLVLRALLAGARYGLERTPGYCMRHFRGSVSRDRNRQNQELARVLAKYDARRVEAEWIRQGVDERIVLWGMASFELFRRDYSAVSELLRRRRERGMEAGEVLEPEGPCPLPEDWRFGFFEGVAGLLGRGEARGALASFARANAVVETAEGRNNEGVVRAILGDRNEALACFDRSLELWPEYADAVENQATAGQANRLTVHPLRREAGRSEYL